MGTAQAISHGGAASQFPLERDLQGILLG